MSAGPLVVEIISVFIIVLVLLHRYANFRQQNKITLIGTFIAWYFSFMIVVLLPLDITQTTYRQCLEDHKQTNDTTTIDPTSVCKEPWSLVPDNVFPVLWRIIYWTSQCLTWLILPFMQAYSQSGEFTLSGKIRGSLIANAIYYGTYMAIFGVLLIYVAIKHQIDGQKLKVIGITASNTWGLFLLVLLLGYGLVAVPRSLWFRSITPLRLKQIYFKVAKIHTEKCEAEENLEDILNEVKALAEKIKYNHPLRACIDLIVKKCPESFRESLRRNVEDFVDYNDSSSHREMPTEKNLVTLHSRLIKATQISNRVNNQWSSIIEEAFMVEDILTNESNTNRKFVHTAPNVRTNFIFRRICNPSLEWIYNCFVSKYTLKLLSIVFVAITVIVIWSEMTFWSIHPVLSIFAQFLKGSRVTYNYFAIEFLSVITIAYLCFCAYYTIFKMRIFNFYYLASNHHSDEYSLIFSGTMICRLTSPLCYNFLGLMHLDSHMTKDSKTLETQFTSIMGHMDFISFISDGFNIYFPMLILLLCLATFFNLGGRLLNFFGMEQFIGDAEITQDLIEDGKNLVGREKRRIQRNDPEVQTRRRDVADRLKNKFSSSASNGEMSGSRSNFRSDEESSIFKNKSLKEENAAVSDDTNVVEQGSVREYRDIPPYSDNIADEVDNSRLLSSKSGRLLNDDPVDYESTSQRDYMPRNPASSKNLSIKNMRGIFDDV